MIRSILASLVLMGSAIAADRGVWLCIGPENLLLAAAPLCELRAAQGWEVERSSASPAEAIAGVTGKPAAILILGDDGSGPAEVRTERLPYHGWKATHPAEFVSDAVLGDFDHDGVPEIPVGRIPARTPVELAPVVGKIITWEKRVPSPSDLTIPVWAGDPGFNKIGGVMTRVSLPFLMGRLRKEAPPWAGFWLLHSAVNSPFCGWPEESAATFNRRLAEGSLFSAMIGHGRTDSWWIMNRLRYRAADARAMTTPAPAAPHIVFACKCGAFADPKIRCLGEELLFAPGGPVACIAASVDSHPLTNYYGSTSLLRDLNGTTADSLGGLWVESIRKAHATREPLKELLVSSLEPFVIGKRNRVKDLKADHLLIYNLLGDPATRLFLPRPLEAIVTRSGEGWEWAVKKPAGLPTDARLIVQHRAPLPSFKLGLPAEDPGAAFKTLEEANASLDFRTLDKLDSSSVWGGTLSEPGTLRLCLTGGHELLVHAVNLAP
ncbi:C25 family cysteine peptidase [Luteolibacter sp. Populi]|uniref:C25 family cysteine peptidase n=1 Tax=Luteolibacter sp. Populi TaxID=3230487 RepID=UPI0034657F06